MTDTVEKSDESSDEIVERIARSAVPTIVVINKIDLTTPERLEELVEKWKQRLPQAVIAPVSAKEAFNIGGLFDLILGRLPEGEPFYPKDTLTDKTLRFFASEIIREKILLSYDKEIPYCCQIDIDSYKEEPSIDRISATIYVARDSQKGIVIGHKGEKLKRVGQAAREDLERFLQKRVFLQLYVKNDPELAKQMAALAGEGGVYVSDAFGAVHRAHASTAGVAAHLPAVSGFLIQKELDFIGGALANPKRPLVAILGGSKVSSKIGVINNLLEIADTIIIGGGMSYTFSAAQGGKVGDSLLEADWMDYSKEMIAKAAAKGVKFLLPVDTVCGDKFAPDAKSQIVKAGEIPDGWEGLDIGPETVKLYCDAVAGAGTVIWNGPMGVFEFPAFAKGTEAVAEALSKTSAITIIGGGDSAAAVQQLGYADKMTHISTGGGASLEFMEGKELPGVACLLDK